jgi:hypothetical protein
MARATWRQPAVDRMYERRRRRNSGTFFVGHTAGLLAGSMPKDQTILGVTPGR